MRKLGTLPNIIKCIKYTLKIVVWNLLVIAFRKHMTSRGLQTLCNGQETQTQWKSERNSDQPTHRRSMKITTMYIVHVYIGWGEITLYTLYIYNISQKLGNAQWRRRWWWRWLLERRWLKKSISRKLDNDMHQSFVYFCECRHSFLLLHQHWHITNYRALVSLHDYRLGSIH